MSNNKPPNESLQNPIPDSNRLYIVASITVLCATIFAIDLNTPLGFSGGVPYLIPILLASRLQDEKDTILTAVVCTGLTLSGLYLSPEGGNVWQVLANRTLALLVIWAGTWFIAIYKRREKEYEKLLHDRGERVKELQCMYAVADSIGCRSTLEEIFQDVAELIPPGWHYPEITRGKVVFDDEEYVSKSFVETEWKQSTDIIVNDEPRGSIEVYYLEPCPELDEGPFMKEERNLLNGIAASINQEIERENLQRQLHHSQRLEAVGQLTGGIAHDFNNILGVVLGNLELIREDLGKNSKVDDFIESAIESLQRGASLTAQLLAFSRNQVLAPEALDLNSLVRNMDGLLRRTLGETIDIETVCAAGLWPCIADQHQVENALLNLGLNARDAMPDGGKLTIETANFYLDENYTDAHIELSPGQYVMLAVSDTGTGMSKEIIAQAFDPFFTTKDTGKGSGLGLSMVYGFAKQSMGQVNIYSEVGKGTTVKLYLPRLAAAEETETDNDEKSTEDRSDDLQQALILVVEDDPKLLEVVTHQLESLGHTVLPAKDGKTALQLFADNENIDLLLTDVVLPDKISGRNVAEQLLKKRPDLKVVYMSGYTENAIVHHNRLVDGAVLLKKPFTLSQLSRRMQATLSSS